MVKSTELRDLRGSFLSNFVRALVLNSYTPPKEEAKKEVEKIKEEKMLPSPKIAIEIPEQMLPRVMMPKRRPLPRIPNRMFAPRPLRPELPPLPTPPGKKQLSTSGAINLGKVTQLLIDPSVLSVECPGPNKNLIVNRSGVIQTAPTILTKEEVDALMNEVSDKTRIPIIPGLFKAAFQDLLMTAVISDFVGTRFMIHKRSPFQAY